PVLVNQPLASSPSSSSLMCVNPQPQDCDNVLCVTGHGCSSALWASKSATTVTATGWLFIHVGLLGESSHAAARKAEFESIIQSPIVHLSWDNDPAVLRPGI